MSWKPISWTLSCAGYEAIVDALNEPGRFRWRVFEAGAPTPLARDDNVAGMAQAMVAAEAALTRIVRALGGTT